jgi:hypothetical protein
VAVGADRELAEASSQLVESNGDVQILVRVDSDDELPFGRGRSDAVYDCPPDRRGGGRDPLVGRTDRTVTGRV